MELRITTLGVCIAVVVEDRSLGRQVTQLLAAFPPAPAERPPDVRFHLRRDDARPRWYQLYGHDRRVLSAGRPHTVLLHLVSALTEVAVSRFEGLAIHSGVVASEGRAMALVGVSGVGKSTLTACCLRAGFDYMSDEALCVSSASTRAVPFPKPLAIAGDSAALLGLPCRRWDAKDLVTPAALDASVVADELPLESVVLLSRSGRGCGVPLEQPPATTVSTLLSMAFNAYRDPACSVASASEVARTARCWTLDVTDPHRAAKRLRALARESLTA